MTAYVNHAVQVLKQQGFRITQPRMHVLKLLDSAETALSVPEIKAALEDNDLAVDMVSVYRVVDCLESNHLVHRLLSDGKVRKCDIDDSCNKHHHHATDTCHHFIRCEGCDDIKEVHCEGFEQLLGQFAQQSGYLVKQHFLELTGLCIQCQKEQ